MHNFLSSGDLNNLFGNVSSVANATNFDFLLNNKKVESSPTTFLSNFLPKANSSLAMDVNTSAENWLTKAQVYAGIGDIMAIPFADIEWELLIAKLANVATTGWTFISFNGNIEYRPPAENEVGIVFDTETFVTKGNYPILATAISQFGLFIYAVEQWENPDIEYAPSYIDLTNASRLIIAHNAAFDFARIEQRYQIDNNVQALCTMAMAKTQFAVDRNNLWLLDANPNENILARYMQQISCKMNLVSVWEFLTKKKLPPNAKEIRNMFVTALTFDELIAEKQSLFEYALRDTVLTLEVFQLLYPIFSAWSTNACVLQGIVTGLNSLLPISIDYDNWLTEKEFQSSQIDSKLQAFCQDIFSELEQSVQLGLINPADEQYVENIGKLDWRAYKPKNWRKKVLPKGWPVRSIWYNNFLNNEFTWGGNDLAYLLQLSWNGVPIRQRYKTGWYYIDQTTGQEVKLPHYTGANKNLGNVISGNCIKYIEYGQITSKVLAQDKLLELVLLLDSTSMWTGYKNRFTEIKTSLS